MHIMHITQAWTVTQVFDAVLVDAPCSCEESAVRVGQGSSSRLQFTCGHTMFCFTHPATLSQGNIRKSPLSLLGADRDEPHLDANYAKSAEACNLGALPTCISISYGHEKTTPEHSYHNCSREQLLSTIFVHLVDLQSYAAAERPKQSLAIPQAKSGCPNLRR